MGKYCHTDYQSSAKAIPGVSYKTPGIIRSPTYHITIHSDQEWRYQMKAFIKKPKDNNVFQSMSPIGNQLDNSPMESFLDLMTQEV